MSFLVVAPDWLESAATDLESIRSSLTAAHAAAAVPTTGIAAAGADEVSAAVAALFGRFGQEYQTLSAQVSVFHQEFVQALTSGAGSYLATEAANSSPLQTIEQDLLGVINNVPTGAAASSPLQAIEQFVVGVINGPTTILFGRQLISTWPSVSLGGKITGGTATAPLTKYEGTEAIVNASVGSGAPVPLLVDTGSTGLVIPFQNVGGLFGLLQLPGAFGIPGLPLGFGIGGYTGGIDYLYATYNAPVNFGGGLVTAGTPVDIEFLAFPVTIQSAITNGFTFQSYFAQDGVVGVLGVGPNAGGPGPSIATQALPSGYNGGLLINENPTTGSPYIQFANTNPLPPIASPLPGAPITNLDVSITPPGGTTTMHTGVSSMLDSGGVDGTFPFSAPVGSTVNVYAPDGTTLLYSYTLGQSYSPIVSGGLMNTGALLFQENPVYIDYSPGGVGTTYID
jgi:hypothetical protein